MLQPLQTMHLILFFTRGVSLKVWDDVGMLEREVEIYRCLRPHLGGIAFLTYGNESELHFASRLEGIEILCNRWELPTQWFACLAPLLYWRQMWQADIFKTNQTNGAEVAVFAKRLFRKKLIARCGYMWSYFADRQQGADSPAAETAKQREAQAFAAADRVVVTTQAMKQYAIEYFRLPNGKVVVIPNYVNTQLFSPQPDVVRRRRRLCFIGRLDEQKNLSALLDAMQGLDLELVIIGNGRLRDQLVTKARDKDIDAHFLGNLPHTELPEHLNQADVFVLPSLYEGHPKTLLEAMACGLPVIGTDAPGIRDLIRHRETGYLCGTSPEEIRAAIQEVLANADLRARLGRNAREFVVEHFALERVVEMELALLSEVASYPPYDSRI